LHPGSTAARGSAQSKGRGFWTDPALDVDATDAATGCVVVIVVVVAVGCVVVVVVVGRGGSDGGGGGAALEAPAYRDANATTAIVAHVLNLMCPRSLIG
jgi:hypothetical protein